MKGKSRVSIPLLIVLLICLNQGCKDPGWESRADAVSNLLKGDWSLNDIFMVDANWGVAVKSQGVILHTDDGGNTWTSQKSGTGNSLSGVCFTDTMHGWAVGKKIILHTNDGGKTWVKQLDEAPFSFAAVFCLDTSTAWAVGSGWGDDYSNIHFTEDGGETWTRQRTGVKTHLFDVEFTDYETGIAVGGWCTNCSGSPLFGGYILSTTNGGDTWGLQYHDTTIMGFYAVDFTDVHSGIVTGALGTILRTTDGGISWTKQESGTNDEFRDVCLIGADIGYAAGGETVEPYRGTILRTTDGGLSWAEQQLSEQGFIFGVCFTDDRTGLAVGYGTIIKTISGGESVPKRKRDRQMRKIQLSHNN